MTTPAAHRPSFRHVAAALLGATMLSGLPALAAPLDPFAFASLGTLNTTDAVTIDTSAAGQPTLVSGTTTYKGVYLTQSGGPTVAVFTFDNLNIATSVSQGAIAPSGTNPLALLSRGDLTLNRAIAPFFNQMGASQPGVGPGAGGSGALSGGGGAFGGAGGAGGDATGGSSYGDLATMLRGGSGGGMPTTGTVIPGNNVGGGAVALVAANNLTVTNAIVVSGGSGAGVTTSPGGGAGGGILLSGAKVTATGSMSASGGPGASVGTVGGGGGGGGRILIQTGTHTLGVTPSANVSGGSGGTGSKTNGTAGGTGSAQITPTGLIINPTGKTATMGTAGIADGAFTVLYGNATVENSGTLNQASSASTITTLTNQSGGSVAISAGTHTIGTLTNAGSINVSGGTVTGTMLSGAGSVTLAAGTLGFATVNAASLTQSGGTMTGTVQVDGGTFTYSGGTFDGRLVNNSTFNMNASFTAGDGIQNNVDMTMASGRTLTTNGQGLENNAILTLSGGTLAGSGALANNAAITGFGTIGGSGGLTNTLSMAVSGGNLTLSNTGPNTNLGQIDLASGRLLALSGAELANQGGLALAGGGVSGTGTLRNQAGGLVSGRGSISASFANEAGGTVLVDTAATTSITKAFANAGTIRLAADAANLTGGKITSSGAILGRGFVGNAIDNSGGIRAEGGTLQLNGAVNNLAGGTIEAATGTTVLAAQGLAGNAGSIVLTGGRVDTNGKALTSGGSITGQGILATGGLTNNGRLALANGASSVLGGVTNNAIVTVDNATVSFHGAVTNAAGGTITVNHSTVAYLGGLVNNGLLVTDPTTLTLTNFTNNGVAAVVADPGDVFEVSGDVLGDTTNAAGWDTDEATLAFVSGGSGLHSIELYGTDQGRTRAGLSQNFAWGTLSVAAGQDLSLADIKADGFDGAMYIGALALGGYSSGSLASFILGAIDGNGFNIYYDPAMSANAYLGGLDYALGNGGMLLALDVPEPATLAVLGAALGGLGLVRRRRRPPVA